MTFSIVKAAALLAIIVACGAEKNSDDARDTVRLTTTRNISSAPLVIAEEEGYFADERITIQHMESPARGMQSIPLLDQGDIDVLASSLSIGAFAAAASGSRIRLVADRGHVSDRCEFNGIIGRRESFSTDSPSAAEVRGTTFSVNSAGTAEYMVDAFLAARGLTLDDVRKAKLTEVTEYQGIATGAVDLMHASEPYMTRLREDGNRLVGKSSSLAPGAHYGVIIYGPRLLSNRDLGQRFMIGYLRGVRRFAEGATPRNIEILSRRMGFDEALLRKTCLASVRTNGALDEVWMMKFQEWAVAKGYAKRALPLEQIIDPSFARAASRHLDSLAAAN